MNFNTEPYHDDYKPEKGFHKILFKPSVPVQVRELNQLQTILNEQITRFGDHIFKQGAVVIPGQTVLNTDNKHIKVKGTFETIDVSQYIDDFKSQQITSDTTGLTAFCEAVYENGSDFVLVLKYTNTGSGGEKVFQEGEKLTSQAGSVQVADADASGDATTCSIDRGVYFVNGYFVLVERQTIIVDPFSSDASASIGLEIDEYTITAEDDETLLDNATGTPNFAANGADRFVIDLKLKSRGLDETSDNFVELIRVRNGAAQKLTERTEYSVIEKTLARRTYDQAGDFVVDGFGIDVREHRNNNRGQWASGVEYVVGDVVKSDGNYYVAQNTTISSSSQPTHEEGTSYDGTGSTGVEWRFTTEPNLNGGVYTPEQGGDESKLAIGLEAGKAYVRGFEIDQISKIYTDVDKSRDFSRIDNGVINVNYGSYLSVDNVVGVPNTTENEKVDLYDTKGVAQGTKVGEARVSNIEFDQGFVGDPTSTYRLFLFDVTLDNGYSIERDVKAVSSPNFSSNVVLSENRLVGAVNASASTTVSGIGTSFQTDLTAGDYVFIGNEERKVVSVDSQTQITIDSAITADGATIGLAIARQTQTGVSSLLFPFGRDYIKTVRSETNTNDTIYTAVTHLTGVTSSDLGGTCELTLSTPSGTFASGAVASNYIVSLDSNGTIVEPVSITPTGSNVTIVLDASYASQQFNVVATLTKTGSILTEKVKTLNTATVTFDTEQEATRSLVRLNKADGYRLISVHMKTGGFDTPSADYTVDITSRFRFNDGQRDNFYDLASIELKSSSPAPTSPIEVTFEYFSHGSGDYFTVNSYPSNVLYKDIPTYKDRSLRDVIDFRPRISDDGLSFVGSGSSTSLIPKLGFSITTDYEYYLARRDNLSLSEEGEIVVKKGVSSLDPKEPQVPGKAMLMYNLAYDPYTISADSSVDVNKVDNRRYTMRDIGRIDRRVDDLEYYTTLNLLEQETASRDIIDTDGNVRLKNGFLVDSFEGHNVGDPANVEYRALINPEEKYSQAPVAPQNVNLLEKNSTDNERLASGYQVTGDLIHLPIKQHVSMVRQLIASRIENVNPFAVFSFIGNADINPSTDDWMDTRTLPAVVVDRRNQASFRVGDTTRSTSLSWTWNSIWTRTTERTITGFRDVRRTTGSNTAFEVIPFMRRRNVLVQANSLKPDTQMWAFFDERDINDYVTPSTLIDYSPINGERFDWESNAGRNASQVERRINGDSQICLNKGDVITGTTSGATAVVVGSNFNSVFDRYQLEVLNVKGTFASGETITGSLSGATASVGEVTPQTTIKTTDSGSCAFLFQIPNNEEIRFRTGTRELRLLDINDLVGVPTSEARADYTATGTLRTEQETQVLTRRPIVSTQVISSRRNRRRRWVDPLAQTFLVDQDGGVFLTKVDLYFASKDANIPVRLEIRETDNGYPAQTVVPFSQVTKDPEAVNVSSQTLEMDGDTVGAYDTPTTFDFESPVYLRDGVEYCLVVLSDSDKYNVWISNIGDEIPGSDSTVTEQPYNGVLFKSQNASTWTANQHQDLMFELYKAEFDTEAVGTVQLVNDIVPYQDLETNPFETRTGSNYIRVFAENHGMPENSDVEILKDYQPTEATGTITTDSTTTTVTKSGGTSFLDLFDTAENGSGHELFVNGSSVGVVDSVVSANELTLRANASQTHSGVAWSYTVPINSIPLSELYKTHSIVDRDFDSFIIQVTTPSCSCGTPDVDGVKISRAYQVDEFSVNAETIELPNTTIGTNLRTTSGKSVGGNETPFILDVGFQPAPFNERARFLSTKLIGSDVIEANKLAGSKSLTVEFRLQSSNSNISPVIDNQRLSFSAFGNRVEGLGYDEYNFGDIDTRPLIESANITITDNIISSTVATEKELLESVEVGKYITIQGSTQGNNGDWLVDRNDDGIRVVGDITNETGSTLNIQQMNHYVAEISPFNGTAYAKYLSKDVQLNNVSDMLSVTFGANLVGDSTIDVYYKSTKQGSSVDVENLQWVKMEPSSEPKKVDKGSDEYPEVEFVEEGISPFDIFKIKLVFRGSDTANPPRAKDLRVIASV